MKRVRVIYVIHTPMYYLVHLSASVVTQVINYTLLVLEYNPEGFCLVTRRVVIASL